MSRRVFFSFHYQRDIWRVNQIRNIPRVTRCAAAGFQDASLWERSKLRGDAAIKRLIDHGLNNTSVTLVCVGAQTASRRWIRYEIEQSIVRGNGLLAIQIHHLKDRLGATDGAGTPPSVFDQTKYKYYRYTTMNQLAQWIEQAALAAGKPAL